MLLIFGELQALQNAGKVHKSGKNQLEELTFNIKYGFVKGGQSTITLTEMIYHDSVVHHAVVKARTTGVTDKIFKVRDRYESYFDPQTCSPYIAIRDISEGGYKFYNETHFDHKKQKVFSTKSGEKDVPLDIMDMVSSFYLLRNKTKNGLSKGDTVVLKTYFDDQVYPFYMRYKGVERKKTHLGILKCHRYDPVTEPGRLFKTEDDMSFWLTADEKVTPVLIEFELLVGKVKMELINGL
ncbi:MAG: DUF3108 domain-containing protein [Bacteroidales bacterium]|nr:DUF3108 domain-containing protein [Bacteroidales bacterium]